MVPSRRSPFADLLSEYAEFAFGDEAVFARRGRWGEFFRERVGSAHAGRLVLEIGAFTGELLAGVAARHPETGFVGLDWKARAVHTAAGRVCETGLRNVALLRGRAQQVGRAFGAAELDEVWIFHPDPCDKPKELANRLFAERFVVDAASVLKAGGRVVLKTDHPGYYQWALAIVGLPQPAWFAEARELGAERVGGPRVRWKDLVGAEALPVASGAVLERFEVVEQSADFWADRGLQERLRGREFYGQTTTFEARFRKKNLPIYYLELRRRR